MVGADGIAYLGFLLEFLGQFHAQDGMRQFRLVVGHFADVVQQSGPFGHLGVQPQFSRHGGAQLGHFDGVLQQVLSVRGTVFHPADHPDQLMVQVMDAQVDAGAFAGFDDLLFDLFLGLGYDLLDPWQGGFGRRSPVYAATGGQFPC